MLELLIVESLVFSTYVEVILMNDLEKAEALSILHVCGGDPNSTVNIKEYFRYSPRMWRWSPDTNNDFLMTFVFSTYVEVILVSNRIND